MTAFTATTGDNYFDGYSGGSTNATLDSYAISGGGSRPQRDAKKPRNDDDDAFLLAVLL